MTRTKITLVLNCLRSGGAEKQLLWIASEIVSSGRDCTVFEMVSGGRSERIETMVDAAITKGVRVLRAPTKGGLLHCLLRLQNYFDETTPNLIWSWGLRSDLLCLLCRPANKRLISVRCAVAAGTPLVSLLQWLVARCSDGVVSNTHAGLATSGVARITGLRRWVLSNVVASASVGEITLPQRPPGRLTLVMLGNIKIHHKGYDLAAQLVQILKAKGLAIELRIAGRPDEQAELEEIFRQFDVEGAIKLYGEAARPEEFLREGHVFLLLSRFEGMPNTVLEALNAGLPAIVTEVGDLRLLKEKGAPFVLIPIENVGAAAEAVEMGFTQWADTREMAAKGRSWVQENFSEEVCRVKLRKILAEVLDA